VSLPLRCIFRGKSLFCYSIVFVTELMVPWYISTMVDESHLMIERVQTGVRIEKRLLKVLKALAEYHDMSLGDLVEGIVLHAFDGKIPFSSSSLERIRDLKKFYDLDLDSSASHRLSEIKQQKVTSSGVGRGGKARREKRP
jgi:hypothetical protein